MKSYVASGSDPAKPEKFLAYMVPSIDEVCLLLTSFSFLFLFFSNRRKKDVNHVHKL